MGGEAGRGGGPAAWREAGGREAWGAENRVAIGKRDRRQLQLGRALGQLLRKARAAEKTKRAASVQLDVGAHR